MRYPRIIRLPTRLPLCLLALAAEGCAFQRYDARTGTQHLWGIGHLAIKTSPATESLPAVVTGQETFGLSAGTTVSGGHFAVGWRDERLILVNSSNASVRLVWPSADFFTVRLAKEPPFPEALETNAAVVTAIAIPPRPNSARQAQGSPADDNGGRP